MSRCASDDGRHWVEPGVLGSACVLVLPSGKAWPVPRAGRVTLMSCQARTNGEQRLPGTRGVCRGRTSRGFETTLFLFMSKIRVLYSCGKGRTDLSRYVSPKNSSCCSRDAHPEQHSAGEVRLGDP